MRIPYFAASVLHVIYLNILTRISHIITATNTKHLTAQTLLNDFQYYLQKTHTQINKNKTVLCVSKTSKDVGSDSFVFKKNEVNSPRIINGNQSL